MNKFAVKKLLDAWENLALAQMYEKSTNFERDKANIEKARQHWIRLLELDKEEEA